jgi:excisionase family DNA binding protein
MLHTRIGQRFFSTTRGRIVLLVRRSARTVDELAEELGLTRNAVREHLATLERDGLVHRSGGRRGNGKPAHLYALTPEAVELFPRGYAPVLDGVLDALVRQLPPAPREVLLRELGRDIAVARPLPQGGVRERVAAGAELQNELGELAEARDVDGALVIQGWSCPLAAVVVDHPELCLLAEAMLTELIGRPDRQRCTCGIRHAASSSWWRAGSTELTDPLWSQELRCPSLGGAVGASSLVVTRARTRAPDMSDYLSVRQAAAECGVAERTVRRWIMSGRLPAIHASREIRVQRADLEALERGEPGMSGPIRMEPGAESDLSGQEDGQVRTGPRPASDTPDMVEALHLIEKLQQQNMELAGRVGYLQAELQIAREQLPLQAPAAPPEMAPHDRCGA